MEVESRPLRGVSPNDQSYISLDDATNVKQAKTKKQKNKNKTTRRTGAVIIAVTEGSAGQRVKRRYPLYHSFWDDGNLFREGWSKQCVLITSSSYEEFLAG